MSDQNTDELQRFTTLVNPTILSQIKLISYFTNQKLYEVKKIKLKTLIKIKKNKNLLLEPI